MLNQVLSKLGLQGIKIDTLLQNPHLQPGQMLQGQINFQGGSSNKNINGIYLRLMTLAEVESGDHEHAQELCIAQWHMSGAFQLLANQTHQIPFNLQLPFETPITALNCAQNKSRVWLHTHLDVDWGLDATDRDYIQIHPSPVIQAFLQAMQQCGYQLFSTDVERGQLNGGHFRSTIGCYQEIEFKPIQWMSGVNEIEVSFVTEAQQTHVLLEIDRKFRGDGYRTLTIPHHQFSAPQLVSEIQRLIG